MKTFAILMLLSGAMLLAKAQGIESIGIKGGVSLSTQSTIYSGGLDNKYTADYKPGVYVVLSAELFKTKYLSLVTDLGYIQKGMQQSMPLTTPEQPEGTGEIIDVKTTFGYLTLSPMLKGFYSFGKLTPYALFGPRIDYRLHEHTDRGIESYNDGNKLIFGLTYGLGAEYRVNKLGILLEMQGQPDLSYVIHTQAAEGSFGVKVKDNSFVFTTGLVFHL